MLYLKPHQVKWSLPYPVNFMDNLKKGYCEVHSSSGLFWIFEFPQYFAFALVLLYCAQWLVGKMYASFSTNHKQNQN